jgi:hypothetical protein
VNLYQLQEVTFLKRVFLIHLRTPRSKHDANINLKLTVF